MSTIGVTNAADLRAPQKTGKRLLERLSSLSLRRSGSSRAQKYPRNKRRRPWSALDPVEEPDEYLLGLGDIPRNTDHAQYQHDAHYDLLAEVTPLRRFESARRAVVPTPTKSGRIYRVVNPDTFGATKYADIPPPENTGTRRHPLRAQDPVKRHTWNAEFNEPLIPLRLYKDDWDAPRKRQRSPYHCSIFSPELTDEPLDIPSGPPQRPPPLPPTFMDAALQDSPLHGAPSLPSFNEYQAYRPGAISQHGLDDAALQRRSTVRVPVGARVCSTTNEWQNPDSFSTQRAHAPPVRLKPVSLRASASHRPRYVQPNALNEENLSQPATLFGRIDHLTPPRPRCRPPVIPQKPNVLRRAPAAPSHSMLHIRLSRGHEGPSTTRTSGHSSRYSESDRDGGVPPMRRRQAPGSGPELASRSTLSPPPVPPKRFSAQKANAHRYREPSSSQTSLVTVIHRGSDKDSQSRSNRRTIHAGVEAFVPRLSSDMDRDSYEARLRKVSSEAAFGDSNASPVVERDNRSCKRHSPDEHRIHDLVYDSRHTRRHGETGAAIKASRKSTADDVTLESLESAIQQAYPEASHNAETNDVADVLGEAGFPAIVQAIAATYPLFTSALVNARDHTTRSPTKVSGQSQADSPEHIQSTGRHDSRGSEDRRDSGYISMQTSPTAQSGKTPAIQLELPEDDEPQAVLSTPFDLPNKLLLHVGSNGKGKQRETVPPLSIPVQASACPPEEIWFDASAGHPLWAQVAAPASQTICCMACAEDLPKFDFSERPLTSKCTHETLTCLNCVQQWLETQLETSTWDRLSCMQCSERLGYEDVRQHGNAALVERYDTLATRALLSEDKDFRWCRGPGCDSGQIHEGGEAMPLFHCRACGYKYCIVHEEVHEGLSCRQFEARLNGEDEGVGTSADAVSGSSAIPGSWPGDNAQAVAGASGTSRASAGVQCVTAGPSTQADVASVQRDEAAARALEEGWKREEEERQQGIIAAHRRLLSERQAAAQAQLEADEAVARALSAELDPGHVSQAVTTPEPSIGETPRSGFLAKLRAHRRSNPPPTSISEPYVNAEAQSVGSGASKLQYKPDSSARTKFMASMRTKNRVAQFGSASRSTMTLPGSPKDNDAVLAWQLDQANQAEIHHEAEGDAALARQLEQEEKDEIKREADAAEARRLAREREAQAAAAERERERIAKERKSQVAAAKQAEEERKKIENAKRRRAEEAKGVAWVKGHSKQCPNPKCGFSIQKSHGCDHMTCSRCRHEFCWECLVDYKAITRTDNTAHQRNCRFHQ